MPAYTLAAQKRPPILRRDAEGMYMTTQQIMDDDARLERERKNRPSSRPPINKDESVFPASGWPTGPDSNVCAIRQPNRRSSTDTETKSSAPEPTVRLCCP